MDYKRVFIEKKEEFNIDAKLLHRDIKEYLGIKDLKRTRIINVYDFIRISKEDHDVIVKNILLDGDLDYVYERTFPMDKESKYFRVEFLPSQYNQREDALAQSIRILLGKDLQVKHTILLVFEGIQEEQLNRIKEYYINPVEMREISLDYLDSRDEKAATDEIETIDGFINMTEEEIAQIKLEYELGLDMEDMLFCQKYFKEEGRCPTITELKLIDTYWSDHCRHTTFMTELDGIQFEENKYKSLIEEAFKEYLESREYVYGNKQKPICLMDLATINMKEIKKRGLLKDLEESEEINAASIEIDVDVDGENEKWLLMFKNETHNHPTEIEPFGGAATCLGGCIRDPLSGRAYVYQAMRITGGADPREKFENTLTGKLPQRKITQKAMEGYSSYGNQIGIPTGFIREIYHEGYVAKRMEVGAVVAATPREDVMRKSPKPGDLILLVGGRTGKDGLGGAVGSSKGHTEESLEAGGAEVQKGNPPLERKIIRLFRNEKVSRMIKKCNDFGAGGVSVAIGELADGLSIDLDKVPLKYSGLDGTEIALSESQERMAVVIDKENLDEFLKFAKEEDLEATVVAKVIDEDRLIMKWRSRTIVDISRKFLDTNGIRKKAQVIVGTPKEENYLKDKPNHVYGKDIVEKWIKNMSHLNNGSQKGLVEKFDHSVGRGTVLMPLGGKYRLTPAEGMVAKIPVFYGDTNTCSLMSYGYEPILSKWSPFHGGMYAVIESLAKITAMGGDYRKVRLSFQEYFERMDKDKKKWGKPFAALLGAFLVQKNLNIPSIGGKDSMSGSFEDIDVPPTLISFAVTYDRVENIISPEFKRGGNNVVLIPLDIDEKGMVDFKQLSANYTRIKKLIDEGKILSASSVKFGGIGRSISEMCFGNKIGFKFISNIDEVQLFLPMYGSIIVEMEESPEGLLKGISYRLLGSTIEERHIEIGDKKIDIDYLIEEWTKPLIDVFPIEDGKYDQKRIQYVDGPKLSSNVKVAKPRVFIPILTGTHGEYDMEKSFKRAGGRVDSFVFKTLTQEDIDLSYKEMANRIGQCQILALPDGAILGNEPDGGGKLIANILKNPYIEEAIMDLLENRDGLILGIGSGFKTLVKSGLLAEGLNITYNTSGYHISTMVRIKIVSNLSPWFSNVDVGEEMLLPLSTKEGRIVLDEKEIDKLIQKGQIATQYVDYNPTGSTEGIEAITSFNGRILGRIANSDRTGIGLYKNIGKVEEDRIFKAGIDYFA